MSEHGISYTEEACSACGWRYPAPVELYHAEGECLTQQVAGRCVGLVVSIDTPASGALLARITQADLNPATGGAMLIAELDDTISITPPSLEGDDDD